MGRKHFYIKPKKLILLAMFIALEIIAAKVLVINFSPSSRLSFGFAAIFLCSFILGPIEGAVTAAIADILGLILFPMGYGFFVGYTITSILVGLTYGLFFYKKEVTILKLILANSIVFLFCYNTLNTLWLYITNGYPFIIKFIERFPKNLIMIPIAVILLKALSVAVKNNSKYLKVD